jgi:hypothetical protein
MKIPQRLPASSASPMSNRPCPRPGLRPEHRAKAIDAAQAQIAGELFAAA